MGKGRGRGLDRSARMIHYDQPVAADLSEKEGIDSADISDLPFQQPFTDNEAIIG